MAARERDETVGFMKVSIDVADNENLGAVKFSIDGAEIVHSLLDVM
jgi:hypothetical protein